MKRLRSKPGLMVFAGGLSLALACLAPGCSREPAPQPDGAAPAAQATADDSANRARYIAPSALPGATPFIVPGMRRPPTEPAHLAELADDAEVIGVSAGGRHRAYSCIAMSNMTTRVINDLLERIPVTVTFCDQSHRARVFTAAGRSDPLTVELGGWSREGMILRIDGLMMAHASKEIPLEELPAELTRWSQWRAAHPETDVFTGIGVDPYYSAPSNKSPTRPQAE